VSVLVVDASVWVAAADPSDRFSDVSRAFLAALVRTGAAVVLPALAHVEIACALARRLQNTETARQLTTRLMASPLISEAPMDAALLQAALARGTESMLRASDACYAALADRTQGVLVAWDTELLRRAGGMTPEQWLAAH
jgi:predicted nucleic acid-binding protein